MIDFDALEKEMAELNEIKKAWDKAWDRVWEIWGVVSANQKEYEEWKSKKKTVAGEQTKEGN